MHRAGIDLVQFLEHGVVLDVVHAHGVQDLAQEQLNGMLAGRIQVQQRGHVVVPVAHDGKQRKGSQQRLGQGQNNGEQGPEVPRAVDIGAFRQGRGNFGKEGAEHEHFIGRNRPGEHNGPVGIPQTQIQDVDVAGHQAAAEEHGDGQQHGDGLFAAEVPEG